MKPDTPKTRTERPTTDRVTVKNDWKSFADLLKDTKRNVYIESIGIKVENIRKTNRGDLMFEVAGDKIGAATLKEEIKKKIETADIKIHSQEALIHVSGIDETVEGEEILDAIAKEVGESNRKYVEVRSLRPSWRRTRNATLAVRQKSLANDNTEGGN